MQPLSAADAIALAFTHTREVLKGPRFRVGRFYKLALVAALTQATFLSVGGLYPLQGAQFAALSQVHRVHPQQFAAGAPAAAGPSVAALGIVVLLIALAIGLLVTLGLLYLLCRLRVTLFDLVVERGGAVRPAWRRHARAARRYFGLYLVATLGWGLVLAAMLGPFLFAFARTAMAAAHAGEPPSALPAAMASQMLVVAGLSWLLLPIWLAVDSLLQDFILPALALEPDAPVRAAFARLGSVFRRSPGQLLLFLLLRTVVGVAIGLALMLAAVVAVGLLALAAFGIGTVLYHWLWTGGLLARTAFFAVAAGLTLLIYALYLLAVVSAYGVTGTFKASYGALFFAGYYPELAARLHPPPQPEPLAPSGMLPQQLW